MINLNASQKIKISIMAYKLVSSVRRVLGGQVQYNYHFKKRRYLGIRPAEKNGMNVPFETSLFKDAQ